MAAFFRISSSCLCVLLGLACGQPQDSLDEIRDPPRRGRFAQSLDRLRVPAREDPARATGRARLDRGRLRRVPWWGISGGWRRDSAVARAG